MERPGSRKPRAALPPTAPATRRKSPTRAAARPAPSEVPDEVVEAFEEMVAVPDPAAARLEGAPDVGSGLRKVRAARSLSLEQLARASGVSRAMLSQIELGRSVPTINVLWRIARALDMPFSALIADSRPRETTAVLRADKARRLTSADGRFSSRALFPTDRPRRVEFYELRLAPRGLEEAVPHPPGTLENLVVQRGGVEISVAGELHTLGAGDAIQFVADVPHHYRNTAASETVMYLVMSYPEAVTAPGWTV